LKPDLTVFFDITIENAIRRMAERHEDGEGRNRMDVETADFYSKVRDAYLRLAKAEPERFASSMRTARSKKRTPSRQVISEFS
jgi:dTMP kinase